MNSIIKPSFIGRFFDASKKEKEKIYKKCRKVALLGATFFSFWSISEGGEEG